MEGGACRQGRIFDFGTELPFDVLCRWLGASPINENKGGAKGF
jgi:hypothetical protein